MSLALLDTGVIQTAFEVADDIVGREDSRIVDEFCGHEFLCRVVGRRVVIRDGLLGLDGRLVDEVQPGVGGVRDGAASSSMTQTSIQYRPPSFGFR